MNTEKQSKKPRPLPSKEYLEECFTYNPETGKLYWKVRPLDHFKNEHGWKTFNNQCAGKIALNSPSNGYFIGSIDGRSVRAHRVIWKLWYGTEPHYILHSGGNKTDNRISQLTSGTQADNMRDQKESIRNTSGVVGVSWYKPTGKWVAKIKINGKKKHLGTFTDFEEACRVRKDAEKQYNFHLEHGSR
jgi:hypothetical protein